MTFCICRGFEELKMQNSRNAKHCSTFSAEMDGWAKREISRDTNKTAQ